MTQRNSNPIWINAAALLVLICGVVGTAHYVKLAEIAEGTRAKMEAAVPGLMYLMAGIALAVLMVKRSPASTIVASPPTSSARVDPTETAADPWTQINPVIEQLIEAIDALNRRIAERPDEFTPGSSAPPVSSSMARGNVTVGSADQSARMIELLDDIRELSMMGEAQKRARFLNHAKRQKGLMLRQARNHLGAGQFGDAERLIEQCIAAYSSDDDVEFVRQQLNDAREAAATTAIENAKHKVEDLMALSRFDEAIAIADGLINDYPTSHDAQALRDRIARERDLFRNAACQRLYDEIRTYIDHRDWRKALAGTQHLLEKFGDLPRAEKVRGTLRTIQDNAEIQERQELEARIQELIRGKRFTDAIELSEELIARFPSSPQADKLRDLLPRLREHAVTYEAGDLVDRS